MGTKSSKTERISSSSKRFSQDDLQSRATEQTDESSLPPTQKGSDVSNSLTKSRQLSRHMFESRSNSKRWPSMLPANEEALDPSRRRMPPESLQYPTAMDGSKTIPVKLPSTNQQSTLQQESDEARYLAKMYDSRTWEMYRRITEARKNTSYQSTTPSIPKGESTSEWENFEQEVEASPSGHEMIFLFDFD
mmetsp:Transcript_26533/g.64669  ORF Transcript_26533/g.64669 Transcript_26533/m.64669 type:complete len:191 (-) Transcript_26533:274-846(-)